jgi:exodeoxyribonuclease VII small subunit
MGKSTRKLKFEDAMGRLDAIVEAMESGEIGIEDSIAKYEEAMKLASHCRQVLDAAELRIKKIQTDAAGRLQTEPFEPGAGPPTDGENAD